MDTTLVTESLVIAAAVPVTLKVATQCANDLLRGRVTRAATRWAALTPLPSPAVDVGESPAPAAAPTPTAALPAPTAALPAPTAALPAARRDPVTGMAVRPDGSNRVLDRIRATANGSAA